MGSQIVKNRRKACELIIEQLKQAKIKSTNSTGWRIINKIDNKFKSVEKFVKTNVFKTAPTVKVHRFWPDSVYNKQRDLINRLHENRKATSSFTAAKTAGKLANNITSREKARELLSDRPAGNCDEKALFCLSLLETYYYVDIIQGDVPNAYAAMCYTNPTYDHVFVCIADTPTAFKADMQLRDLGVNGVILDGWVEDFYFPNSLHRSKPHNPAQLKVKSSIKSAKIMHFYYPSAPIPLLIF